MSNLRNKNEEVQLNLKMKQWEKEIIQGDADRAKTSDAQFVIESVLHRRHCRQRTDTPFARQMWSPKSETCFYKYSEECKTRSGVIEAHKPYYIWSDENLCLDCFQQSIGRKSRVKNLIAISNEREDRKALTEEIAELTEKVKDMNLIVAVDQAVTGFEELKKTVEAYNRAPVNSPEEKQLFKDLKNCVVWFGTLCYDLEHWIRRTAKKIIKQEQTQTA